MLPIIYYGSKLIQFRKMQNVGRIFAEIIKERSQVGAKDVTAERIFARIIVIAAKREFVSNIDASYNAPTMKIVSNM